MRLPKVYGQSSTATCPFCGDGALSKNEQGIPVCKHHTNRLLPELKCVCGSWLDQRESKFGVFFTCISCGPVSFTKMMETNGERIRAAATAPRVREPERRSYSDGKLPIDRIREKVRRGEPLTLEELDLL